MADYEFPDDEEFVEEPAGEQSFDPQEHTESYPSGQVDDLSTADLEEAYLKALEAMESAEWAVADVVEPEIDAEADIVLEPESDLADHPTGVSAEVAIAGVDFLGAKETSTSPTGPVSMGPQAGSEPEGSATTGNVRPPGPAVAPAKPVRVIEACLFVGGQPLSARKLANLLDGNNEPAVIESLIDELNLEYAAQARPYEIRLGDGGYRLALKTEFDAVRNRVYGVGPRDVKLSQDVLEVLALVAYQQPVTHAAIEACKPNSANTLRQLLRRELISLTRVDQTRNGVEYRTTPRFLQLFGLGQLSELPRPEELSIR